MNYPSKLQQIRSAAGHVYTKPFLLSILIGALWVTACNTKDKQQEVKPGLELTAELGGIIYLDTTIHISTTLFNPTDDTMTFVSMTCSYEDMFLTHTSDFTVQTRNDCFSNFPTVTAIPPHSKLDQFIMVKPSVKDIELFDKRIKIGMYYLAPGKGDDFKEIVEQYEKRNTSQILWSNELALKRFYRTAYQ